MATFAYEGRATSGEVRKGQIVADNETAARAELRRRNITPTIVKSSGGLAGINIEIPTPSFLKPKVKTKDLVLFTRQFATMIDSGLPLIQCLEIQAKQAQNPTFREQIQHIKEQVESGKTFADALQTYESTFDPLYRNMVAAGEVGGILDTILNRLAVYLEKADKLRGQVVGAMMYPTLTIIVAGVVVTLLLLFVVPSFETMFADMGSGLPAPTQFVIDLSEWLQSNVLIIIGVMIAAFFGVRYAYNNDQGREIIDGLLLRAPALGDTLTKVSVARFCRTMGTMISSGVPILDALDICSRTAGNRVVENAIIKVRNSIQEGRTIAEPLMEEKVFPDMVGQMINVGESTGALDTMLNKIADFYEEEVDQSIESLTSMLEPMIMVFLGVVIGGVVIAMYMPVFSMASNVGG
ncbi:MAG: type II secretion system F family protein [Myxococcota bacterium]